MGLRRIMEATVGDGEILDKLMKTVPWLAPILAFAYVLKSEFKGFRSAGKGDTAMEGMTAKMVELFTQNIDYFGRVAQVLGRIETELQASGRGVENTNRLLDEVLDVQRGIKEQMLVQNARQQK